MRVAWLVGVIGCSATSSPPVAGPDAAAPIPLDLDVVVGTQGVEVFTNASDYPERCYGDIFFPQVGQVAFEDDVLSCRQSCLTSVAVERDGATIGTAMLMPSYPVGVAADFSDGAAATLVITGCGGSARIPVGTQPIPTPTA